MVSVTFALNPEIRVYSDDESCVCFANANTSCFEIIFFSFILHIWFFGDGSRFVGKRFVGLQIGRDMNDSWAERESDKLKLETFYGLQLRCNF